MNFGEINRLIKKISILLGISCSFASQSYENCKLESEKIFETSVKGFDLTTSALFDCDANAHMK